MDILPLKHLNPIFIPETHNYSVGDGDAPGKEEIELGRKGKNPAFDDFEDYAFDDFESFKKRFEQIGIQLWNGLRKGSTEFAALKKENFKLLALEKRKRAELAALERKFSTLQISSDQKDTIIAEQKSEISTHISSIEDVKRQLKAKNAELSEHLDNCKAPNQVLAELRGSLEFLDAFEIISEAMIWFGYAHGVDDRTANSNCAAVYLPHGHWYVQAADQISDQRFTEYAEGKDIKAMYRTESGEEDAGEENNDTPPSPPPT